MEDGMRATAAWHIALMAALAVCAIVVTAGCGGGGGSTSPGDTTAPTVSGVIASPSALDFAGGQVLITAQVSDASGVGTVSASVVCSSLGTTTPVPMSKTTGNTYSGQFAAPPNPVMDGTSATYSVRVSASDTKGNSASSTGNTFVVDPPDPPPVKPGG
jgi:hypothetical protein